MKQLIKIAHGTGATVEFKRIPVLGRCDYQNKVIYISNEEPERKQVIILAHELGHWLSYLNHKRNTSLRRNDREKLAYEYGWPLLVNTGLMKKYQITKEEWYEINAPNFSNRNPDTKLAWE